MYDKSADDLSHVVEKAFAELVAIDEDWMQVVELRLKACKALMKASWETNSAVCEELFEYLRELQATYTFEDSEGCRKQRLKATVHHQHSLQGLGKTRQTDRPVVKTSYCSLPIELGSK
jgi:hypothetical protein